MDPFVLVRVFKRVAANGGQSLTNLLRVKTPHHDSRLHYGVRPGATNIIPDFHNVKIAPTAKLESSSVAPTGIVNSILNQLQRVFAKLKVR